MQEDASDSLGESIHQIIQDGKNQFDLLKRGNPEEVADITSDKVATTVIEGSKAVAGSVITKAGGSVLGSIIKDKNISKAINNRSPLQNSFPPTAET